MKLTDFLYYVGVNDRTKHRFEGLWHLPHGVSYNSYLLVDEKVALVDTVDVAFFHEFLDNIRSVIGERSIDYLVINHMEPDHSGSLELIRQYYPGIRLVGNKKTMEMVQGFFGATSENDVVVGEGEVLSLGVHDLRFHLVPMLHWPETMVTYVPNEGILFSGDAFGCFGALDGGVLDTQLDTTRYWPEMERYYASILGKYATPVQSALKKLGGLELRMICSTHGPVWTEQIGRAVETYRRFSAGETQPGLVVAYGSMYGNTARMAEAIARGAAEAGLKNIVIHNLSVSPLSDVLADVFRYGALAVGTPTYNTGIFPVVDDLLKALSSRVVSRHKFAAFGGYTWSGQALKRVDKYVEKMGVEVVADALEWKQTPGVAAIEQGREMGRKLAKSVLP